jgi:hypothetical protein
MANIDVAIFEHDNHVIIESAFIGFPGADKPIPMSASFTSFNATKSCAPACSLACKPASSTAIVCGIARVIAFSQA